MNNVVKTKCVKLPPEPHDGKRFLVTRGWPPFKSRASLQIQDWIKSVAPSRRLLADWRGGAISWDQYVRRYTSEMSQQTHEIEKLAKLAEKETITLLCYEREGDPHCHRYLLKEMIEEHLVLFPNHSLVPG